MNFTFGGDAARKRMLLRQEKAKKEALRLQNAREVLSVNTQKTDILDKMKIEEAKIAIKKEEELKQKQKEEALKRVQEEDQKKAQEEETKKKEEELEKKRARKEAMKKARAEAKKKKEEQSKQEDKKEDDVVKADEIVENVENEVVSEPQE